MKEEFYDGLEINYQGQNGTVRFVCDSYITMCIHLDELRFRDVCIVIPSERYSEIKLKKQSDK